MPIIENSSYKAPLFFRNAHLSTICTALFRANAEMKFTRERLETSDNDFVDLDWIKRGSSKLAILCHGLEGSSDNAYISNAAKTLSDYDICALNYRGCSGEPNRLVKSYHSGKTEDLAAVIDSAIADYGEIYLIGFSVGGNLCLKYLGERSSEVDSKIKAAVVFSVPVSLECCAIQLAKPENFIYMRKFLVRLEEKIKGKEKLFPGELSSENFYKIKSFLDYDEKFTAPLNGFKDAKDYWTQSSCARVLDGITTPSLLVSAKDDPFLGEACYPAEAARKNPNFFLEMPEHGGHVGFGAWQEERIVNFLKNLN